eukprot:PhM_4_TR7818/c0_g1_i1/m.14803/K12817/PRPF18, PRP18; pre-mRNA-splicing factor 18
MSWKDFKSKMHKKPVEGAKLNLAGTDGGDHHPPATRQPLVNVKSLLSRASTGDSGNATVVPSNNKDANAAVEIVNETKAALRALGEPATLFGETQQLRAERLAIVRLLRENDKERAAADEERRQRGETGSVTDIELSKIFMSRDDNDVQLHIKALLEKDDSEGPEKVEEASIDDTEKEAFVCHSIFRILKEWHRHSMVVMSEIKSTAADLRPLLELLQTHRTNSQMLQHLYDIFRCVWWRVDYVEATQRYFLLSIGNEPWPFGIPLSVHHCAVSRERISTDKTKHWMNDAVVSRYVKAVKKLLGVAQMLHPTTSD